MKVCEGILWISKSAPRGMLKVPETKGGLGCRVRGFRVEKKKVEACWVPIRGILWTS